MALEFDGSGNYEQPTPQVTLDFPKEFDEHSLAQWMAEQMSACPTEPDELGNVWNPEAWSTAVWVSTMEWVFQRGYGSAFFVTVHHEAAGIYQSELRRASARWWRL